MNEVNALSNTVIGESIRVHNILGPGLLERVYEECLCYCLNQKGLSVERQKQLPIKFEDIKLDGGLRLDLLVEDKLIVELKAVEKLLPVHDAQLYTYLKLSGKPLGLMINFNVKLLKQGIKRMVMTPESLCA